MKSAHIFLDHPVNDCFMVHQLPDPIPEPQFASDPEPTATNFGQLIQTDIAEPVISALPQNDYAQLLESISKQIETYRQQQASLVEQFQELAIQLGAKIAESILGHEVPESIQRIRKLVISLFNSHETQSPIVVYVNTIDLAKLRVSLQDSPSLDSKLQLKPDDSISAGNCRIESDQTTMVADWKLQLADIHLQLMEYLHETRLSDRTH